VAGAGLLALVAFNYAYSNDPFGPFLPGNAWEQGALQGSTWLHSLPGQWLHLYVGLLNSSPVFLASALGLALLLWRGGPQGWGVLAFYLATAGTNGLHPDWTFGFCPPARFLLTALPVLLLGLAFAIREYGSRLPALFALLGALALSLDSLITTAGIPEQAVGGSHLSVRTLNEYYPLDIHFTDQTTGDLPWGTLGFWGLLGAALLFAALPSRTRPQRRWALALAALLPFAWSQAGAFGERQRSGLPPSPYLIQLDEQGRMPGGVQVFNNPVTREYRKSTGHTLKAGGFGAQAPDNKAGILRSYYAPLMQPGVITYALKGIAAEHAPGQVAGHFSVAQRQVLPAVADWAVYHTLPITEGAEMRLNFSAGRTGLAYVYVEFAGAGALSYREVHNRFLPLRLEARRTEVGRFGEGQTAGQRAWMKVRCPQLPRGLYLAQYHLRGMAPGAFFQRKPAPVYMGVYADQNTPPGGPDLETQARRWLNEYYPLHHQGARPDFLRPLVESIQAPWWTAMPLVGEPVYQVEFGLSSPQDVWLLFDYNGDQNLSVEGVTLYRLDLRSAVLIE